MYFVTIKIVQMKGRNRFINKNNYIIPEICFKKQIKNS